MADNNPDLAAQEVDDDLRRDQLNALWKAYGRYVIGGAVGIVLAVGGSQFYKYQVNSKQEANSIRFDLAAEQAGKDAVAAGTVWADAVPTLDAGFAALAALREAAALAKAGDTMAAIEAYDTLAASTNGDIVLREYAQLLSALLIVDKVGDLEDARSRFSVLAQEGQPWRFSAQEQLAFIDYKQGDIEAAFEGFAALADSSDAPQTISARARQFRDMLERQMPAKIAGPQEEATTQPDAVSTEGEASSNE